MSLIENESMERNRLETFELDQPFQLPINSALVVKYEERRRTTLNMRDTDFMQFRKNQ